MNLILQLGALAVALTALGLLMRAVYRAWKKVDAFLEDWNGEPARPGRAARPSMPARMAAVEKQVTPNGGNTPSLADRVVRLERHFGTGGA